MSNSSPVLVTGAAGFIGFHVASALLARGERVLGIDNLNDYYDPRLKEARLALLARAPGFSFRRADIADREAMLAIADGPDAPDRIVHLAAQAGVRYSLVNPYAYVTANVMGQVVMQELARRLPGLRHFVYASSSSVYGGNTKLPFAVEDRTDTPVSLYAATKKADELIAHAYAHLYAIPSTGLRFFTVYGPWGRPDMAAYLFASAMTEGREITVYNNGEMSRDFTFVDDIVAGVLAVLDRPPPTDSRGGNQGAPARVYNIGNNRPEPLMRYIGLLEDALGVKAKIRFAPKPAADVVATFADIEAIRADAGFAPTIPIDVGIPRFVAWFKAYHGIA